MEIIEKYDFYDSNPVGKLIEFFQENGRTLTFPDPIRISKANEPPLYRCTIRESILGEIFTIISEELSRKCYARKDAAQKFLYELGLTDKNGIGIKSRKKGVITIPKQSLSNGEIFFSKSSICGGYFKKVPMELSTETGETIVKYAMRKAKKTPFFLLISLSGRLDTLSGSTWHASLKNVGELILLHLKLYEKNYFDIGFGESKSKAKKEVALKIIESSNLYQWLKDNYSETMI